MAVKLKIGNPVVVAHGPRYDEVGWGPYQFPSAARMDDGRIAVNFSDCPDTMDAYGSEAAWCVSADEGRTWTRVTDPEERRLITRMSGLKLPSGKRLRSDTQPPVKLDPELYAALKKKTNRWKPCLGMEEIPDGIIEKFKWHMAIYDPETDTDEKFLADVDWPTMTTSLATDSIVRPMPFAMAHVAPDGSIWQAHYWDGRNPDNGGFTNYYALYFFRSTDEGRSYKLMSWIQYVPDSYEFKDAFQVEGFCEQDFAFMPDGSVITLMRTDSRTPSFIARSTDGAKSWSKPVIFDKCGVLPKLLYLKCGATIASYGRPGLFVRATDDPSGQVWDDAYELMPYDAPHTSCYYTSLLEIDERTALLFYSDWTDGQKNICCRTVTVES